MTEQNDAARRLPLGVEPEDLDGHTIDELSDYLDAGRRPLDPSIEGSAGCRLVLDALVRLRGLTPQLLKAETEAEGPAEEGWVQKILAGIALDARAGRRIPISAPAERADLGITEGAVRGLIRSAEASVPGVLVGRCRLEGDVTHRGAPIRIQIDVSVPYGPPILDVSARLRAEIAERLIAHTELNVTAIDITVHDIHRLPAAEDER
jgi:hypothetical protein